MIYVGIDVAKDKHECMIITDENKIVMELLPYHAMGEHKWSAIGKTAKRFSVPSSGDVEAFKQWFNVF